MGVCVIYVCTQHMEGSLGLFVLGQELDFAVPCGSGYPMALLCPRESDSKVILTDLCLYDVFSVCHHHYTINVVCKCK